jgi:hypothetical protein
MQDAYMHEEPQVREARKLLAEVETFLDAMNERLGRSTACPSASAGMSRRRKGAAAIARRACPSKPIFRSSGRGAEMTHAEILSGIVQYAASGADVVRILAENGLVIVPKEPTGEMVSAGCRGSLEHEGDSIAEVAGAIRAAVEIGRVKP